MKVTVKYQPDMKTAYKLVLESLKHCQLFRGTYDAANGTAEYMYGVNAVMENIAYSIGCEEGKAFSDEFTENMVKSKERARRRAERDAKVKVSVRPW